MPCPTNKAQRPDARETEQRSSIMSSAPTGNVNLQPHEPSVVAAILSYLIPGLGQIYQGRYGKGFLFMVSLLGMFTLGQAMGNWQNVYFAAPEEGLGQPRQRGFVGAITNRWHYGGQFWIGIAAWPALWQHFDGPLPKKEEYPFWHDYQRAPDEAKVNAFLVNSDKTPDLGWVYTVIAGMLNILVIYDAYAGPMIATVPRLTASKGSLVPKAETKRRRGSPDAVRRVDLLALADHAPRHQPGL